MIQPLVLLFITRMIMNAFASVIKQGGQKRHTRAGNTTRPAFCFGRVPAWTITILLLLTGVQSALAQCDVSGLPTLPRFEASPSPYEALSPAERARRIQRLAADETPGGLWQRAQLERSSPDSGAQGDAIRHLAQIVAVWFERPRQNSEPDEGEVLFLLASALAARGEPDRARQVFHRFIRAHPTHRLISAAYLSFAEHFVREGDAHAAERFLERVESFSPPPHMRAVIRYLRFYSVGQTAPTETHAAIRQALLATRSSQGRIYAAHLSAHCH